MSDQQLLSRIVLSVCLILTCSVVSACGSTFTWQEEVLLHDGKKLIVERTDIYDSSLPHELGQGAPLAEHATIFTIPGTRQPVAWKSNNRSVAQHGHLDLLALDFLNGVPYVATIPNRSVAYDEWNRPNPPYVFFRYVGEWKRISLQEFPEIFAINVVVSSLKNNRDRKKVEAENRQYGFVRAETVAEMNREPGKSREWYSIIRTPLDAWRPRVEHLGPKAPNPLTPVAPTDGTK